MWALGILLYQFAAKKLPYDNPSDLKLQEAIRDTEPPEIQGQIPDLIRYLIEILLRKDPESRPDATSLLNIPEVNKHV